MANGVARGPDGTLYASNDFAGDVDRIRAGRVEPDWAKLESSNGLAVDTANRFLYVVQTFRGTGDLPRRPARPGQVTTYASPPAADGNPLLDGMVRDGADRLYVAANGAGEVWRVDRDRSICALARGLSDPSMVELRRWRRLPDPQSLRRDLRRRRVVELSRRHRPTRPRPPRSAACSCGAEHAPPAGAAPRAASTFTVTRPTVDGRGPAAGAHACASPAQRVSTDRRGRAVVAYRFSRPRLRGARASRSAVCAATVCCCASLR